MSRFLKLSAPLLALALLFAVVACTHADDEKVNGEPVNADISLQGVELGTHVMGPQLTADNLNGKVVVFEYWGDQCPPCHASIPGIVKLRGEHDRDKLEIVANQVWTKDVDAAMAAWEQHGGDDSITVVNHASLKGADHRGVPHAYIMDHTGKLIWRGNPHPRAGGPEMKEVVEKAVAALPDKV